MPNWCYTNYVIEGREEEVAALHKIIQDLEAREESLLPNGFGKLWLGNLVHTLGGDWKKIYCRGQILDYSLESGILRLNVESAWGEMEETRHFIQSKYPGLKIIYQAEESGMCIFETNDKDGTYFPHRWILDFTDESRNLYFYEYFETLPEAADFLKQFCLPGMEIEATKESILAALDDYQNEHPDPVSYMFEEFKVIED